MNKTAMSQGRKKRDSLSAAKAGTVVAAFDFGSNSIKFGLYAVNGSGGLKRLYVHRAKIALGDDAYAGGSIKEGSARQVEEALRKLMTRMDGVDGVAAAATSALRDAANGAEMTERFSKALGAPVRIVDGEEEARLIAHGVIGEADWTGDTECVVLDIGGGSAELIRALPHRAWDVVSLPIGAIRLRELHKPPSDGETYSNESLESLEAAVAKALIDVKPLEDGGRCLGSGGGFTTIGEMLMGRRFRPGARVSTRALAELRGILRSTPAAEIVKRYELPLRRARIMLAAATTALRALERLQVREIEISFAGMREGLAWQWLEGHGK